jgi:hypothetical protein
MKTTPLNLDDTDKGSESLIVLAYSAAFLALPIALAKLSEAKGS